jgi:transposase
MSQKPKMRPYTKKEFDRQFPSDAACLEWLKNYLYPDGIFCKNCDQITKHHRVASRPSYSCDHCGNHVHPTADTIFHKSTTPLTTWFYAIYLMSSTRCGISAKQIERETGVTYKTAWRMFKQIRTMLKDDHSTGLGGPESGGVEMDETYFGGVRRGVKGKPAPGDRKKTAIVGIVERKGRIRAMTSRDTRSTTLLGLVKEHILPNTTVFTDEYQPDDGIGHMKNGYTHKRIKHSEKIYVAGDVHTNTVEGFWSLLKGGIRGVYHSVGSGYLQSYLDEYSFRYNRRYDEQPMFVSFLKQISKTVPSAKDATSSTDDLAIPF